MRTVLILFVVLSLLSLLASVTHAQDTAPDFFVESSVDNTTPFIGEQLTYTFRFFNAVASPERFNFRPPDFTGLIRGEIGEAQGDGVVIINNRQYSIIRLDLSVFPTRTGEIIIEPATFIMPVNTFSDEQGERVLQTEAHTLQVQSLPAEAPADFTGAVGDFDLVAALDRASARLGDPITLKLTVTGSGNLQQLSAPELPLPVNWRIYGNPPTYLPSDGEGQPAQRVFEWLLFAPQLGSQTLPEITLNYFDPVTQSYRSIQTAPVTLDILPAPEGGLQSRQTLLAPAVGNANGSLPTLKSVPTPLENNISTVPGIIFWALWPLPPALMIALWIWQRWHNRQSQNRVASKQATALISAHRRLSKLQNSEPNRALPLIAAAIYTYLGDKRNHHSNYLSESDLPDILIRHNIAPSSSRTLLVCIDQVNQARFARNASVNTQSLIKQTMLALSVIDAAWEDL